MEKKNERERGEVSELFRCCFSRYSGNPMMYKKIKNKNMSLSFDPLVILNRVTSFSSGGCG